MKYRLIHDHASLMQPWFRIEQFRDNRWALVDSGMNENHLRQRFQNLIDGTPEFTVLEEAESA
ncbi:MAG TPA: hypothetical protein VN879_16020 [Candidatus Acidoferrales bacterium]|nr:hypothetical protein [Candidatus Acidoferrales bacterium]